MVNFESRSELFLLTFQQVVANCEFKRALRFLNEGAQVEAIELIWIADLRVFKLSLEFKKDELVLFGAFLHTDGNGLDKHDD